MVNGLPMTADGFDLVTADSGLLQQPLTGQGKLFAAFGIGPAKAVKRNMLGTGERSKLLLYCCRPRVLVSYL